MVRKYTNLTFFTLLVIGVVGAEADAGGMVGFAVGWMIVLGPIFVAVWVVQAGLWLAEHY